MRHRGFALGLVTVGMIAGFFNGSEIWAQQKDVIAKTHLLQIEKGGTFSDIGSDDKTKPEPADMPQKPGVRALKVAFFAGDSVGLRSVAVKDWRPFGGLQFEIHNPSEKAVSLSFNLFHAGTKNFDTRVVQTLSVKPGANAFRIAIGDLKNVNGSRGSVDDVRRFFFHDVDNSGATLYFGDIVLVRTDAAPNANAAIKTDPRRLERIRANKMPTVSSPVLFNTPEADAICAALEVLPPDNPWNTLVEDWPVHPNSQNIIQSIGSDKPFRNNPDMGFVLVPPDQKKIDVKIVGYAGESDPGPFPVPENTPIEGWPKSYPGTKLDAVQRKDEGEADRHAIVVDPVGRKLYEFYQMRKTDSGWQANCTAIFDLASNRLRPDGWTSSDAAGLPIFPAVVRYDELARGSVDHALRVTVRRTRRAYVYPATHFASKLTDENLPRMGERIRLKKNVDVSKFSPHARIILTALKRYGMLVADNGIEWAVSVAPDERISDLHEEFRKIKGSDFEVVEPPPGYERPE